MMPTDWALLEFLAQGARPIAGLLSRYPKGTVYRRLRGLRAEGLIATSPQGYALTSTGERALAERDAQVFIEGLGEAYPPLRDVPTPQHRAWLELALAALALRRHTDQEDRHAGLLILGPTLSWKTSAAEFLAVALGVDPTTHIADLRAESGQSLWIRRGPTGDVITQRRLVNAPIAVFDEYQAADRAVRRAVAPFLTGKRRLAIENDVVTIAPVPIVILNPAPGATLAARTGLSAPQLRRLIPLDVTGLTLSDLAASGTRPLAAARRAGPCMIPVPQDAADTLRAPLVEVLRTVLTPDGAALLDVEVVLGLGRGMTAWFSPTVALRQALYNTLLVVETVGWVKPGWVDAVRAFPNARPSRAASTIGAAPGQAALNTRTMPIIPLFPERRDPAGEERAMSAQDSMMPAFTLSETAKAELVWLSRELQMPLDMAVGVLIDHYRFTMGTGHDFGNLQAIAHLRKACAETHVTAQDLRDCVELKAALREHDLAIDEVRDALEVAKALDAAGLSLEQAQAVATLSADLEQAGIDTAIADELRSALTRYQALGYDVERLTAIAGLWSRLEALGIGVDDLAGALDHLEQLRALGLDQATAEALARALEAAGITTEDRGVVLHHVVDTGCAAADRVRLDQERARRAREVTALKATLAARRAALTEIHRQIDGATTQREQLQRELTDLTQQAAAFRDAIVTATALERFLLQHTAADDPFWSKLELLLTTKRSAPALFSTLQSWLGPDLRQRVRAFLDQIAGGGTTPATGAAGEA
ncbi:hypothetical protein HY522_07080 [bacterium]|nr:hypothetical protein [bacterium]